MRENYRIEIDHFYSLKYIEGEKSMVIEIDFRDSVLYLSKSLITKWECPDSDIEFSSKEKNRILNNIRKCLIEQGWKTDEVIIQKDEGV